MVKDYDTYFEKYIGRIFYRIISKHKLKNIDTVVEFAPGFRYKIAYALKRINFKGTLYIIDYNSQVLDFVYKKYKRILPEATIITIKDTLINSAKSLPKEMDLFLTNHSIDDLMVSFYIDKKHKEFAFNNEENSKTYLTKCWNGIEQKKDIKKLKEKTLDEYTKFLNKINFRFIIMSQYKSGYYSKDKNNVEDITREIFDNLKDRIKTDEKTINKAMDFDVDDFGICLTENGIPLKENIQNTKNWIAGKYTKE